MSKKYTFSIGGIHPNDSKISAGCAIEQMSLPKIVYISMAQHLGAPAKPVVAVGDEVLAGQVIGEPSAFMSAFVHSSVAGKVKSVGPYKDIAGNSAIHVAIEVAPEQKWVEGVDLSKDLKTDFPKDRAAIIETIKNCGIVGLGGATFPTHIKLTPPPQFKPECLIINGAECEPYLTSDNRMFIERTKEVITGVAIIKYVLNCRAVIGIEENKPEAIAACRKAIEELRAVSGEFNDIDVYTLKKKYPQGGEKQLIAAVMGREVASGALPISVGAVVQNVTTAFAVYEAVQKNKPLVENVLTITGEIAPSQHNYAVKVGTPLSHIIDVAFGEAKANLPENYKLISGGPMMGKAVANVEAATLKGTSSLLFLSEAQTVRREETNCIRCGRCADACPMGLEPFLLNKLQKAGLADEMEENAIQDCIECGSCQFSCPAGLPLLDYIRLGKRTVMGIMRARAAAKK